MDNNPVNISQSNNRFSKFLNLKVIFVVLGVVVLAEVMWALWTFFQPTKPPVSTSQTQVTVPIQNVASISLNTAKNDAGVKEKFNVDVNILSAAKTDATDVIIIYDPKLLSVEATGSAKIPLKAGNIYDTYPQNRVDTRQGKVIVSGITNQKGGVDINGLFGTIIFQAKTAGQAKISIDYTPGSTTDSNIIESGSGKDILGKVENLEINIQP